MDAFGTSFSPLGNPGQQQQPGQAPGLPSASPIQDAIRILSLRIPRVVGGSALGPLGLLTGQGSGGFGGGGGLESWLQHLFGNNRATAGPVAARPYPGPSGQPGPSGPPKLPDPNVIFRDPNAPRPQAGPPPAPPPTPQPPFLGGGPMGPFGGGRV